jgi:hypothetical protein
MSDRIKTIWAPALVSLTGSMVWRLILQRSFPLLQPLLNHAGLPLNYQLIWLAALPVFGAASAYLSMRAGGNRTARATAALAPSIAMIPLWAALATRMSHPSPSQWFGLLCGVLNWIVVPSAALLLGAFPFLKAQPWNWQKSTWQKITKKSTGSANRPTLNPRTQTFWIPALVSLTAAMIFLMASTMAGVQSRMVATGWATLIGYVPWLIMLPFCGAAGAALSLRARGERWVRLTAGLFPVIAMASLVGFLALIGKFVFARPEWLYLPIALLLGVIVPGAALLAGAARFAKES